MTCDCCDWDFEPVLAKKLFDVRCRNGLRVLMVVPFACAVTYGQASGKAAKATTMTAIAASMQQTKEERLVNSLRDAREVSVRLTEHRHHQNFLQGVFRLEISTVSQNGNRIPPVVMEMDGDRDPTSSWPVFKYTVAEQQCLFLSDYFLPALEFSLRTLESLSLEGCGRVSGLLPRLLTIAKRATFLSSVSIIGWAEFSREVDPNLARMFLSRIKTFSLDHENEDLQASNHLASILGSMADLTSLRLRTGPCSNQVCIWLRQSFLKLLKLEVLQLVGRMFDEPSSQETYQLCSAIGSRHTLRKLELGLHDLTPKLLSALLQCHHRLETLIVHGADYEIAEVIGQIAANNTCFRSLHLSLAGRCSPVRIIEASIRHPTLRALSLNHVCMDNDVAKMIQLLFNYNSTLKKFTISSGDMELSYMQDMLLSLGFNETLESADILCNCELDENTSQTLQDVLTNNATLLHLNFGKCTIPSIGAPFIYEGILSNSRLLSLAGLESGGNVVVEKYLFEAIRQNRTIYSFTPTVAGTNFYLELNALGRQHFVDPTFPTTLMPFVLEKGAISANKLQYMLQSRPDVFSN